MVITSVTHQAAFKVVGSTTVGKVTFVLGLRFVRVWERPFLGRLFSDFWTVMCVKNLSPTRAASDCNDVPTVGGAQGLPGWKKLHHSFLLHNEKVY